MKKGNLKESLKRLSKALSILSLCAAFGATTYAQVVNDDLKPAIEPKKKTTAKVQPKSVTRKSVKSVQPKSSVRRTVSAKINPTKFAERSVAAPSETPDQIIKRFMNFQQTAGVSDRDWRSIVAQTAKILESNPNNAMAKAQSLIAQGQLAFNQRNYSMAAIHFKSALQILPQSSLPHYSLGKTYLANGQAAAAERSFKTAIEQNENFALAYKGMGDALNAQGDAKKATKYFKKATEISVRGGNMPL